MYESAIDIVYFEALVGWDVGGLMCQRIKYKSVLFFKKERIKTYTFNSFWHCFFSFQFGIHSKTHLNKVCRRKVSISISFGRIKSPTDLMVRRRKKVNFRICSAKNKYTVASEHFDLEVDRTLVHPKKNISIALRFAIVSPVAYISHS